MRSMTFKKIAGGVRPLCHKVKADWRRVALNGKLYAFGGEFFNDGGGVYPEAWAYDPATDAWTALPDMPHPRHGLGAVALGEDIYVIGGALRVGGSQTSDLVEIFTPTG